VHVVYLENRAYITAIAITISVAALFTFGLWYWLRKRRSAKLLDDAARYHMRDRTASIKRHGWLLKPKNYIFHSSFCDYFTKGLPKLIGSFTGFDPRNQ
jgi:hypothetical protein